MKILGNLDMRGGTLNSALLEGCSVSDTPASDSDIANKKYVDDNGGGSAGGISDAFYTAPQITIMRESQYEISYIHIKHPYVGVSGAEFVLMYKTKRQSDNRYNKYGWVGSKKGWTVARNERRMRMAYRDIINIFSFNPDGTDMMSLEAYIVRYYTYPMTLPSDARGEGMRTQTSGMDRSLLAFNWSQDWHNKKAKRSRVFGIACRRKVYDSDGSWHYEYSNVAKFRATLARNAAADYAWTLHFSVV